ncbi:hypothetical protein CcCBS67573_g08812 [Chytriomyces confervae]|uniref:G-protein coupled receptors family 1 profile domain-containing protein n=1 Tax=Chytriomyces confervae TaxID=246404 RepID=A0A507EEV9_9FUNG|nr:hypothetical protein CcCBS67573_g08812 [Chytriomyces confervae]
MPLDTLNLCFSTVFALLGIIGSTANLLVVLPNVRYLTRIAPSSFLVFWLCLFDSVAVANSVVISLSNLASGEINFDADSCRLNAGVAVFGNISSILLCFGLTLFRYLIVVHQKDLPKNFATWFLLGVVFSATLVAVLPFIMGSQEHTYKMRPCNAHCAPDWSQRDIKSSILIWICFSIATITLCFVVYAYGAMAGTIVQVFTGVKNVGRGGGTSKPGKSRKIRQQTDKMERTSTVEQTTNSMLSNEGTSSNMSSQKNSLSRDAQHTLKLEKRQRDIMMQSIVVVGAFMIGWAPYICMAAYEYFSNSRVSPAVDFAATGVVAIYELVNPLIIMHFDRDIGKNCRRAFFSLTCKRQIKKGPMF